MRAARHAGDRSSACERPEPCTTGESVRIVADLCEDSGLKSSADARSGSQDRRERVLHELGGELLLEFFDSGAHRFHDPQQSDDDGAQRRLYRHALA